jgi:hypothetical protein
MESLDKFLHIEEVTVQPRKAAASGCDLCQHCWLMRKAFLEKKRQEKEHHHCTDDYARKSAGTENR